VSSAVYNGFDAKLQVLNTERSAGSIGRKVGKVEKSTVCKVRQVSSTEQSVFGAELDVEHGEIHDQHRGAKCQSTEQSVDLHGAPSTGHGAIRERYRGQGVQSRAIC